MSISRLLLLIDDKVAKSNLYSAGRCFRASRYTAGFFEQGRIVKNNSATNVRLSKEESLLYFGQSTQRRADQEPGEQPDWAEQEGEYQAGDDQGVSHPEPRRIPYLPGTRE